MVFPSLRYNSDGSPTDRCTLYPTLRQAQGDPGWKISPGSVLLHLKEFQFHRCSPAENCHQDFQLALLFVDFFDDAVEVSERSVHDPHALANGKNHLGCWALCSLHNLLLDLVDLVRRKGCRIRSPYEPRNLGLRCRRLPCSVAPRRGS